MNRAVRTNMRKIGSANKRLDSSFKNKYKPINPFNDEMTLAVYDKNKLMYEKRGNTILFTVNEVIEFINNKYGTNIKIKNNGGK